MQVDLYAVAPHSRLRTERFALLLLAALTAFVVVGHSRAYLNQSFFPDDFAAFYCAGKVVLHREDPYRVEPLLSCETGLAAGNQPRYATNAVMPAPLPAYVFVPLALLATLPAHFAAIIFLFLLLGATGLTAYCLARMSALPIIAAVAIAFMATTYSASPLGQISPFAIAAVATAALLLRLGSQRRAAVAASAALIQPQFGLPIVVAMFLFIPRVRLVIVTAVAVLMLGALAATGPHAMIEYLSVLSIHARSELNNGPGQYSFTWLSHALGASARLALATGVVSYIASFTTCLLVFSRTAQRAIKTGAIVLLPPAFAVFGGSFIHDHQISVAVLAAIVLVQPASIMGTSMFGAALLSVPFGSTQFATYAALPAMLLTIIAVWCVVFFPTRASGVQSATKHATLTAIVITAVIALLLAVSTMYGMQPHGGITISHHANAIASLEAQQVYDAEAERDRTPLFYYLLLKLPTWCGLMLTLWFSCRMLLSRDEHFRSEYRTTPATGPAS